MGNIVLKISQKVDKEARSEYYFKDVDVFQGGMSSHSAIYLSADVEAVKQSVRNILTWNMFEEVLYPEFGNRLRDYVYQPLDQMTKNDIVEEIRRAIETFEPRAAITSVDVLKDEGDGHAVGVSLTYRVIGGKGRGDLVQDTISFAGTEDNAAQF